MDTSALTELLTDELRAIGTPERAAQEKRYLKSDLEFFGGSVREIRRVVQAFIRGVSPMAHDELLALVEALWAEPVHERRMASVVLLELHPTLLTSVDLPLIERLLRESLTWALVDGLAGDVVGGLLARSPAEVTPALDRWSTDSDFWIRRASLLAELQPLRAGADLAPFLRRADGMLDGKEFFIRKAIGWVLRDVGKRRPAEVVAWLGPRTDRASGVTMREAVKYLPPADADRLMAAYQDKRPATMQSSSSAVRSNCAAVHLGGCAAQTVLTRGSTGGSGSGATGPGAAGGPADGRATPAPHVERGAGNGAGTGISVDLPGVLDLNHRWLVPAAPVAVPGLLVILWVLLQAIGALAWIPSVRRMADESAAPHRQVGGQERA